MVDGITPHKSPLFERGRNVVAEVILPHFRVRPFCVVVLSSLWNPEVPGSNLGTVGTNSVLCTSIHPQIFIYTALYFVSEVHLDHKFVSGSS